MLVQNRAVAERMRSMIDCATSPEEKTRFDKAPEKLGKTSSSLWVQESEKGQEAKSTLSMLVVFQVSPNGSYKLLLGFRKVHVQYESGSHSFFTAIDLLSDYAWSTHVSVIILWALKITSSLSPE
jgi:hypothetical protein